MASSTGFIVAAGAMTFGNEWLHGVTNWKIPIATAGIAVVLAGMEQVPGAAPFAVGIGVIALITTIFVRVTPGVPTPAESIINFINNPPKKGVKP